MIGEADVRRFDRHPHASPTRPAQREAPAAGETAGAGGAILEMSLPCLQPDNAPLASAFRCGIQQ
jgi:hypothetical protein